MITAWVFSEYVVAPELLCVKFSGLSFEEGAFLEPLGVAIDLIKTADIKLNDDVLVMGLGPIGLMALQMAKRAERAGYMPPSVQERTRKVVWRNSSERTVLFFTDKVNLAEFAFERGGVNHVLVTSPPDTIDVATRICAVGGIVSFLGIGYGERKRFP